MKRIVSVTCIAILVLAVVAVRLVAGQPQQERAKYKYSCVVFNRKGNMPLFEGHISAAQFQTWFTDTSYTVTIPRMDAPKDAETFGALVVTNGAEILVMPLYTWKADARTFYACQTHTDEELLPHLPTEMPPMFSVVVSAKSEKVFIETLKASLHKIGKAEQKNAPDKKE